MVDNQKIGLFIMTIGGITMILASVFWLMILDFQTTQVKNLNAIIEEQQETIYRQKREINQAWKRGNFWIFEANRRGRG